MVQGWLRVGGGGMGEHSGYLQGAERFGAGDWAVGVW